MTYEQSRLRCYRNGAEVAPGPPCLLARIAAALAIAFVAIHSPEPTMPWQRLVAKPVARRQPCGGPDAIVRDVNTIL